MTRWAGFIRTTKSMRRNTAVDARSKTTGVLRLNRAERELGADGAALVHDVLIQGMTMEQVGQRRGLRSQRWNDYFSRRLRECLDRLALLYGFAADKGQRVRTTRTHAPYEPR
jgi:hypothetical protein